MTGMQKDAWTKCDSVKNRGRPDTCTNHAMEMRLFSLPSHHLMPEFRVLFTSCHDERDITQPEVHSSPNGDGWFRTGYWIYGLFAQIDFFHQPVLIRGISWLISNDYHLWKIILQYNVKKYFPPENPFWMLFYQIFPIFSLFLCLISIDHYSVKHEKFLKHWYLFLNEIDILLIYHKRGGIEFS